MATSGEKRWPPVGNFVAASGEKPMAIDMVDPRWSPVAPDRPATEMANVIGVAVLLA
jgi:hypothetical protein